MNCREARSQITQPDGSVAPDALHVHARGCAACGRILEETQRQRAWLRGQFDRASRQLIEQAPPFSMAAIRQRGMQPRERPPALLWTWAVAAAVLLLAAIGWWQWPPSPANAVPAPLASAQPESEPAQPLPIPAPRPKLPVMAQAVTEPGRNLEPQVSPPPVPLFPNVAGTVPLPQRSAPPRVESHVFAMEPTVAAPNAGGYMVAILPEDAGEFSPTMFVLSVTGLTPDAVYYVTVGGPAGERVQLASVKTDAHGSAAVMLQGKTEDTSSTPGTPVAAGSVPLAATPPRIADASPSVTLDGTGPTVTLSGTPSTAAPGILSMRTSVASGNLPVVTDALGNPVMIVNPVSTKNP